MSMTTADTVRNLHSVVDEFEADSGDVPAYCEEDNEEWPCCVIQALDEAEARIDALTDALRGIYQLHREVIELAQADIHAVDAEGRTGLSNYSDKATDLDSALNRLADLLA